MTNAEAIKIAAAIREQADQRRMVLDGEIIHGMWSQGDAIDALKAVAETIADVYATGQRVPDTAKQAFMNACGL